MSDSDLRLGLLQQLKAMLDGGQAHATFDDVVRDMPYELQGQVPPGLPYSPWQLLEHLRLAQKDIVDFSDNADGSYVAKQWPADYWPHDPEPVDAGAWQRSVDAVQADRSRFEQMLETRDLTAPFPWGDGQNLLREALLIASHESYHLGELVVTRRLLGAWRPKAGHA